MAAWTPSELPGLQIWVDASDAGTITTSGATVTGVTDKAGLVTFSPTGLELSTMSGLDALSFASNGYLPFTPQFASETISFIAALDGNPGFVYQTLMGGAANSLAPIAINTTSTDVWRNTSTPDVHVDGSSAAWATRAEAHSGITIGAQKVIAMSGMALNATGFPAIGKGWFQYHFNGLMGEVVIVSGTLSTDDRQKLEGYLAHKWGSAASLPGGHPYENDPPQLASSGVSGSLDTTESGTDALAATGGVSISGELGASEQGFDTVSAGGTVAVQGTFATQETGPDGASASGGVTVSGALAGQEAGNDNFGGGGAVLVSGGFAASEAGSDAFSSAGIVAVSGTLSASEAGDDSFAGVGGVLVTGVLDATESGSDAFAGSGSAPVEITGTLEASETGSDVSAITGSVRVSGGMSASEAGQDTLSASASVFIAGVLGTTEAGQDAAALVGGVSVSGALDANESVSDAFASSGMVLVSGAMAAPESGADDFSGAETQSSGPRKFTFFIRAAAPTRLRHAYTSDVQRAPESSSTLRKAVIVGRSRNIDSQGDSRNGAQESNRPDNRASQSRRSQGSLSRRRAG